MEQEVKKLEIKIEGMRLERDRLIQAYKSGELTEDPFDRTHELNHQILELSFKLNDLQLRDTSKYNPASSTRPNPVELFATWCEFYYAIIALTWLCGAVSMRMHGEGLGFAIFGIGFAVIFIGLPGLLLNEILNAVRDRLGEVLPTYYCSISLFSGGIRQALQRCWENFGVGTFFTLFVGIWITIGNMACLFNPDAFTMSIVGVLFLSIGGFFVIGVRIAIDVIRGTRKARQVF